MNTLEAFEVVRTFAVVGAGIGAAIGLIALIMGTVVAICVKDFVVFLLVLAACVLLPFAATALGASVGISVMGLTDFLAWLELVRNI